MSSKVYCDDWSCPARVSCANHFGRSEAYAAMRENIKVESVPRSGIYKRDAGKESCGEYRLDKPKDWLMLQPGQIEFPDLETARLWSMPHELSATTDASTKGDGNGR